MSDPSAHSLREQANALYTEYGPAKAMRPVAINPDRPKFFLQRRFLGDQDLLVILNTTRCRYHCSFCVLPLDSRTGLTTADEVIRQFSFVLSEMRHGLGTLDRLTLSNDGSVLDASTLPGEALYEIAGAVEELRRVRTLVLETRLEFVVPQVLDQVRAANRRVAIDILTGFETWDDRIRSHILGKRERRETFLRQLDEVAAASAQLTAYVLFKPDPRMTDADAVDEAERSINFLREECRQRALPLTIRLNPMYVAAGSPWAERAAATGYEPPKLSDVLSLAERKRSEGVGMYIGLATEDLESAGGSYRAREDYHHDLLRRAIIFNSVSQSA